MQSIVTVTMNPALDKSTRVAQVAAEQKLACDAPRFDPGGGSVNVARTVHELGGSARAVSLLGGAIGEMVHKLLDQELVDQHPIAIGGTTRTNLTVLDEASGQQYRFGMPGPTVQEDEWQQVLSYVREAEPAPDYLVASGSLPPGVPDNFYAELATAATERGARYIVDTRGKPLRAAVARGVYLIKPNARELGMLADTPVEGEEEQEAMARNLVAQGKCQVVVVSLGAAGVLLVTDDRCQRIRAPSVKVVSKIGAGDSTVAGIVLALARGNGITEAVRFGVAAGAAAVMSPGTHLCNKEDVERLYEKINREGDAQ